MPTLQLVRIEWFCILIMTDSPREPKKAGRLHRPVHCENVQGATDELHSSQDTPRSWCRGEAIPVVSAEQSGLCQWNGNMQYVADTETVFMGAMSGKFTIEKHEKRALRLLM